MITFGQDGSKGRERFKIEPFIVLTEQMSLMAAEAKKWCDIQNFTIQNCISSVGIFLKETNMLRAKCVELPSCGTYLIKKHGYVLLTVIAQLYITLCVIDYPM